VSMMTRLPFDEVFADESAGNIKTPQSEYLRNGHFPVVDQGKALIAGYVNEPERICGGGRPAIVFGDHTRCVKFVDRPFCMGADGVKVLRPKIDADLKYLYYYLKQLPLPDAGYDRHFKYLKRTEVVLLPLPEQRRVSAILDKADALRTKRRETLAELDRLGQSIFVEMFGDPVRNPKMWPVVPFASLCSRVTVGIVVQPASYYKEKGIPALRSLNIKPGRIVLDDLVYFSEEDNASRLKKTQLRAGDLVLVRSGQPGTTAVVPNELDGINAIDILIASPRASEASPTYLCSFFNSSAGRALILSSQRGQIQKHLNVGSLNSAAVMVPPIGLQREFEERISDVERLSSKFMESFEQLDSMFDSLQHRALRGEL
jgi:type I restriction enzyme, S subunit